jgi:hypothetical protein
LQFSEAFVGACGTQGLARRAATNRSCRYRHRKVTKQGQTAPYSDPQREKKR